MEELDIEQDKQIDPDMMDVAWLEQTNLVYKYSEWLNEQVNERNRIRTELDHKEKQLDTLKAKIELEARETPESFGLEKVTDSSVKAVVLTDPRYLESLDEIYNLKSRLDETQANVNKGFSCVNTIQEKKEALQGLDKLLSKQYFSVPLERDDLSQKWNDWKEKQREAKEKVKRRKKRRE